MSGCSGPRYGEIRSILTADGASLEYEVLGDGPAMVMLHGFAASRHTFSLQRNAFADRYRLIMISARGHDGSDSRLPPNYGAGASDVEDLRAVLVAEQVDRASFFAHSSGGATAFTFARRYPDRVSRAVLIEPTLFAILPPADHAVALADNEVIVNAAETGGPEAGLRAAIDLWGGDTWRALDAETQEKRLRAMASCAPLVGPHMRGLSDLAVTEADVCALSPPTLLFYGAESLPFEAVIARRFHQLRPDLRLIMAERAGHSVHRDRSDLVNAEALAFLDS